MLSRGLLGHNTAHMVAGHQLGNLFTLVQSQTWSQFALLYTIDHVTCSVHFHTLNTGAVGLSEMLVHLHATTFQTILLNWNLFTTYRNIILAWFLFWFPGVASNWRGFVENSGYCIGFQLSQSICSMRFKLWFFKMHLK